MDEPQQIYVTLLDEGCTPYRPVMAEPVGPMIFRLLGPVPEDEKWEFQPGDLVLCKELWLSEGLKVVAVAPFGQR